jgi:RNA polymerase sigma-70 factor, ECF subfamily
MSPLSFSMMVSGGERPAGLSERGLGDAHAQGDERDASLANVRDSTFADGAGSAARADESPHTSLGALPGGAQTTDEHVVTDEPRTFDALYEAQFPFVWRTLRRFGVPASVAEDAAQDVFVVLHRKLADLRPEASAKGFLFSIARRVASDYRRASRRPQQPLDVERTESAERGPFERTAERQASETLERFLDSLDEDKRVAFMLVELEGLTMPEVSRLLQTNLNTLYSRVRAARAQLMALFASDGVGDG